MENEFNVILYCPYCSSTMLIYHKEIRYTLGIKRYEKTIYNCFNCKNKYEIKEY